MVLVQFAVDDEGQFLGTTKNVPVSMHHTMRDLWKGLVNDGLITQVRRVELEIIYSLLSVWCCVLIRKSRSLLVGPKRIRLSVLSE